MRKYLLTRRRPQPLEEGYILVAVMFMLAILIIAMALAAPRVRKELQRDREIETIHRGKQYARAVKLYYKKFGTYPASVDALVNTNQIRFLRKKYIDPTTGKEEWKPIRFGQQKTQSTGFFGQPIAGAGMPGAGLGGGNGLTGPSPIGGVNPLNSNSSTSLNGNSSTFGSTDPGNNPSSPPGTTGSNPTSPPGATGSTTDPSGGQSGGTASGGSGTGSGSGSAFGTPGGQTGQTFGGGGIIGFSPTSPKQSILVYRKKNHYNEWEF
ncbi:MAG TPA: type II secretion system protein, partial [Terracidiphilus sp.]